MRGRGWWLLIGCVMPLLLIFVAPFFGISGDWGLFLFIGLMFLCHLGMMGRHGGHRGHGSKPTDLKRGVDSHETIEH